MSASSAPSTGGNLPAELTSFVGRRQELAELKRLLGAARLVTLTGVGGAGKTRLALRAASVLARGFADGAWFVDLAEVEDGALLAQSIATRLGLHDRHAGSPADSLTEYLGDKNVLLVLDNCDHLRDECAVLAESLLRRAPDLRILATSRHTLGLTAEHVFHVPPLTVPEASAGLAPDAVAHYEALNLFVERAQAVSPTFKLTTETLTATAAICQRLDGIPLAIELAAARLRVMSVTDLLDRMEDRYRVLIGGSSSALPRHRTLRELIGWSWDLCTDVERVAWARASVLPSSFDMSAAEAICSADASESGVVLETISALVDKSILIAQDSGGRIRYRMLETLRQFGSEQLVAMGEQAETRERHRMHFTAVARRAGASWFGNQQRELLSKLRLEHSNLRTALETSLENPDSVDTGLLMASDLWFFWIATGQTHEAQRWLERGIKASAGPSAARTRAEIMCAYLCVQQEDLDRATPLIEAAEADAASEDDGANRAWALQVRAMVSMCQDNLTAAEPMFDRALEAHRANEDIVGIVDALFFSASLQTLRGDLATAERLSREAIITCERYGEDWTKGYVLWGLGLVAWQEGDVQRATSHARSALRIAQHLDELWAITFCLEFLAWTAASTGEYEKSAHLLGGARELWRRVGWRRAGVPLYYGMRQLTGHHNACIALVGDHLGAEGLDASLRSGASLGLDELIAQALGTTRTRHKERAARTDELPSLTRRELEVAGLVSQGLSNRVIAERLVISPRTVDVHVENILAKLGFKSRTQIAAWVVEQRAAQDA